MEYTHPLYHGAWHQPPTDEQSARHRSLHQERSEATHGLNLATWHDAARYEASRMDVSNRMDRERQMLLERQHLLEQQELERRRAFEIPEQKYIPEQKFIPPTETEMRLESEIDSLFNPDKSNNCPPGPSEVIESTPDIPGTPQWVESEENEESDVEWKNGPPKPSFIEETEIKRENIKREPGERASREEPGNPNAIDPINEAPRIEKWFRINPNAGKNMIDQYTFKLNELRKSRYEKLRKENPEEAVPFPKLEARDVNAWFTARRGGASADSDDQMSQGNKSSKGGKKSNGSGDTVLVRCQPCQRIFASMDAMRAHQKSKECLNYFVTRKPSGDSSKSKEEEKAAKKLKRKELKKQMKKSKKKSTEDDTFEELGGWVGHFDPTKFTPEEGDTAEWKKPGKKPKGKRQKRKPGEPKVHKYNYNPLLRHHTITNKKFKRTWDTLAEPEGHHECPFCGEVYTKTASLEKHIGRSHNPTLSVQCPECPKKISNKNAMKKHLLSHRPKETWPWYCEYCDDRFQAKGDIPRHWMTSKHKDDPKVPKAGSAEWKAALDRCSTGIPYPKVPDDVEMYEPTAEDKRQFKRIKMELAATSKNLASKAGGGLPMDAAFHDIAKSFGANGDSDDNSEDEVEKRLRIKVIKAKQKLAKKKRTLKMLKSWQSKPAKKQVLVVRCGHCKGVFLRISSYDKHMEVKKCGQQNSSNNEDLENVGFDDSEMNDYPKSDNFFNAPRFLSAKIKHPFGPGQWGWIEEDELYNIGIAPLKQPNLIREICMIRVDKDGYLRKNDQFSNNDIDEKMEECLQECPQECQFCGDTLENSQALAQHVMTHFALKQKIALPSSEPFVCPLSQYICQDKISMLQYVSNQNPSIYEYHTDDYVCARIIDRNEPGIPDPEDDDDEKDEIDNFENEAMDFLKNRGQQRSKRRKFQIGPGKWAWMVDGKIEGDASPPHSSDESDANDSDDFNIRHEQEDTVRQVKRRQCTFCTSKFEELQDLRNHTLSHFKKQLLANLPTSEPFNCPTCQEISPDSTTLLHHYAFTHQMIYDYCTEDDLVGKAVGAKRGPKKRKEPKDPNAPKRETGITKEMKVSPELQALIETDISSRTACVKKLWAYIKENKLQDPKDGRYILPDEKLATIFGTERLRGFSLTKYLGKHLTPLNAEDQNQQELLVQKEEEKDYVWQCAFCDESSKNRKNLTLHTVSHFNSQLLARLPTEPPYTCPTCQTTQRDQVTLVRHYALGHRAIFEFCAKDDLGGHRKLMPEGNESAANKSQSDNEDNNQNDSSGNDSSSGSDSGSDSDDESGNENNQNSSQGQYTDNQYSAQEPFDENSMNNRTQ